MLFMVVEHFRDGNPGPVYDRFRSQGRLAPEGLRYVNSWVDFDVHAVMTSPEAAARVPAGDST